MFKKFSLINNYKKIEETSELPIFLKPMEKQTIQRFTKGQLISKCLFGVFTFFQKTNENKSTSS